MLAPSSVALPGCLSASAAKRGLPGRTVLALSRQRCFISPNFIPTRPLLDCEDNRGEMSKRVRSREVCADCSATGKDDGKQASFSLRANKLALLTFRACLFFQRKPKAKVRRIMLF